MSTAAAETAPDDKVLVITRVFDAPRDLLFRVWTERAHLARWSCPRDLKLTAIETGGKVVQAGASYRICMTAADGTEHWLGGVYRQVTARERLIYTAAWEDADGRPGHETIVDVGFAEDGPARTQVTLHQSLFASRESRDGHGEGWGSTFDHLAEYLSSIT